MATDPVYAKLRVRAGCYLVVSDDGRRVYRLSSYDEDGSAFRYSDGGGQQPIKGTFWQYQPLRSDHVPDRGKLVIRNDAGRIVDINTQRHMVDLAHWGDVIDSVIPTLRQAWRDALEYDQRVST